MIKKTMAVVLGVIVLSCWVLMWISLFWISDSKVMITYLFGACFAIHVIPFVVIADNVLTEIKDKNESNN